MLKNTEEKVEIWVLEFIERTRAISAIKTLRQEWQDAAGDDLYQVEGNVGMLLDDVARLLGITPEELA